MRSLRPIKSRVSAPNPALGPTDATGAPAAPRRAAAVAAANGTAQQLIVQWDRSSRTQRIDLLARFINRHQSSTAAEMEESLGPAALLFFSRIMTWMRLTYQLGFELSVQLSALSLFLQGQRFLSTFAESGGIEMITDILRHIKPSQDRADDKRNALVLLIHLANSGRVYRELVCDCDGVDHIVVAALEEKDPKTLEFFTSLFLALGQGNPRKASLVHVGLLELTRNGCDESALCAAGVLRALQMAREQATLMPSQQQQHYQSMGATSGTLSLPAIGGGNTSNAGALTSPSSPAGGGAGAGSLAHVPVVGIDSTSPASINRLLDTLFHLLRSDNVKLRFEGVELLSLVSKSLVLVVPIVDRCLQVLDEAVAAPASASAPVADQSTSLPAIRGCGSGNVTAAADPMPAALGDLRELKAKAQLRRLQLSCGRALCAILLQPAEDARLKLYRHFEARGGHMSIIKYLGLCDSRNDTAIEEACNALRLLAYAPALAEGQYGVEAIVERSRTAAYLASVLGKELLMKVLEGPTMAREQVLVLFKALRREGLGSAGGTGAHQSLNGGGGTNGAPRNHRASMSTVGGASGIGDSDSDYEDAAQQ